MITERKLLKLSAKHTLIGLAISLFFWFVVFGLGICHAQTQTGYRVPAGYDCGNGARVTSRMNFQIGTGSTFVMRYGTTTVTGSGTAGYMMGTDSAYPRWVWTPATNRMNFLDITLQQNGVDIAAYGNSAALAAALSDETGTNTVVFSSSPTLSGNINFPSGIWNSSGNVGIGTTGPGSRLSLGGADASGLTQRIALYESSASADNFYGIGMANFAGGMYGVGTWVNKSPPTISNPTMVVVNTDATGSVGIGTTTPSNILTLPIASGTDPIADSWTQHCLADYKDIGTETVEMIQDSANDKVKNTPVSVFTKKAMITDEEAEREPKQKYLSKMDAEYKADLKVFGSTTAVAMQDTSYITELFDSMWDTKTDRLTIVEANKQKLIAKKKVLPKFQRKNYGIVAEDAPPEAQVLREDGSLQGVDTSVLVGILWANAQKQEARILALETKIEQLKAIINP